MDRVLLIFDDLQYAGHLEMTLRKVGFDTETITNEYNLSEKLLTFNPDFIIVKGNTSKVSCLQIGKKLKETVRYQGRVILIFPPDTNTKPDELIKLRMDLLLFEPISALRLMSHLLTLTSVDQDAVMDKLLRIAVTDPQFRQYEQQILRGTGDSIDSEIQLISSKLKGKEKPEEIDEKLIQTFVDPNFKEVEPEITITNPPPLEPPVVIDKTAPELDPAYLENLKSEMQSGDPELPLRIATYNSAIKAVGQDLKKGLTKRYTKSAAKENLTITTASEKADRDAERKRFAAALWKKK